MSEALKKNLLYVVIFLPLILIHIFSGPIAQNQNLWNYADEHTIWGLKNFHNIISNIPFTIVSLYGIFLYSKNKNFYSLSWLIFLVGVFLVAPGSMYYHYATNEYSLIWDRLPMTIGFMGITSVVLCEVFELNEHKVLWPLLGVGFYSIFHWIYFDDLRIYFWVQLTPILALLYTSMAIANKTLTKRHLFLSVLLYVGAKFTEHHDYEFYEALSYSGHSIKHVLAALSVLSLVLMKHSLSNKED